MASRVSHEPAVGDGLELDSNNDTGNDTEDDDSYEACDSAAESGPEDHIGEVSQSSLWASIRDYLTPPDVLVVRTVGPKWKKRSCMGNLMLFGSL